MCELLLLLLLIPLLYWFVRCCLGAFKIDAIDKRAIFITGCDSGFGFALCVECARLGMTVFAGCLHPEDARDDIKAACKEFADKVFVIPIDISSDISVAKAWTTITEHLAEEEGLWAVVNNAGINSMCGPDDWCSLEDYKRSLDVNTLGVIRVCHAFKPLIKKSRGRFVTMTSIAGHCVLPFSGPYSVSKYALEAYMDTLRLELACFGVKCCVLEPSAFRTPFLDEDAANHRIDAAWSRTTEVIQNEYGFEAKENFKKEFNEMMRKHSSSKTEIVTNAYIHALTARYPKLRYRCGFAAQFQLAPMSHLPTEITDLIIQMCGMCGIDQAVGRLNQ